MKRPFVRMRGGGGGALVTEGTSKPAATSLLRSASVSSIGSGGNPEGFLWQRVGILGASPRIFGSATGSAPSADSA